MNTRGLRGSAFAGFGLLIGLALGCSDAGRSTDSAGTTRAEALEGSDLFQSEENVPLALREHAQAKPGTVRSRFLRLKKGFSESSQSLVFNLFDDVRLNATRRRTVARGSEDFTWFGQAEEGSVGEASILMHKGILVGHISTKGRSYEIKTVGVGLYEVREIRSDKQDCGDAPILNLPPAKAPASSVIPGALDRTIRVLVAYTREAREATLPPLPGIEFPSEWEQWLIEAEIRLGIDDTNDAFANSGIDFDVELAGTREVDMEEDGTELEDYLDWLTDKLSTTSSLSIARRKFDADLVSLWVQDGIEYCGLAHVMRTVDPSFAPNAASVVDRNCQYKYSFTHELAHNFGALHDWFMDSSDNPYVYAHGYVNYEHGFRTMMAYDDLCTYVGTTCDRIKFFSTPDLTYRGYDLGLEYADNARTLNETGSTVASFSRTLSGSGLPTGAWFPSFPR